LAPVLTATAATILVIAAVAAARRTAGASARGAARMIPPVLTILAIGHAALTLSLLTTSIELGNVSAVLLLGAAAACALLACLPPATRPPPNEDAPEHDDTFYRAVVRAMPAAVAVLDERGEIVAVNDAWRDFATTQGAPEAVSIGVGLNYLDVTRRSATTDTLARASLDGLNRVLDGENTCFETEYPCPTPTGDRWYLLRAVPRRNGRGLVVTHTDITLARRVEEAYRVLAERSLQGLMLFEGERVVYVNPALVTITGYSADEFYAADTDKIRHMVHADDRDWVWDKLRRQLVPGTTSAEATYRIVRKDGCVRWLRGLGTPCRYHGRPAVQVTAIDITDTAEARDALRATQQELHLTQFAIERASDAAYWVRPDASFAYVNEAACHALGYTRAELLALRVHDVDPECSTATWRSWWSDLRRRRRVTIESTHRQKSGATFPVELSLNVIEFGGAEYVCVFARDITERRRAERLLHAARAELEQRVQQRTAELAAANENLRRSERLASIGTLAAGIAHELNNPLGTILLDAEEALERLDEPAAVQRILNEIRADVNRCARIVKSVLQFARQGRTEKWTCDVNGVVRHAVDLLRDKCDRQAVQLVTALPDAPLELVANPTELEQALFNLLQNALNACDPGGRIEVATTRVADADMLRLTVRDDGCGMSDADRARAFDPFFTTRFDAGGTGLGLSTCHGIVTEHGGTIELTSAPGRGTTVTVELPLDPQAVPESQQRGEDSHSR
jgi:two-component system NtrC family sensor kinase